MTAFLKPLSSPTARLSAARISNVSPASLTISMISGLLPGNRRTASRISGRTPSVSFPRASRRRTGFREALGFNAAKELMMARMLSSRRVSRAATEITAPGLSREPLSAKTSSHALTHLAGKVLQRSRQTACHPFGELLFNRTTMPASLTVEDSSIRCAAGWVDLRTVEIA